MNCHLSKVKIQVQTYIGALFFEVLGRYCNTSRLHCRTVYITLFSFIGRGFEGMLFQENVKDFGCILECILI